MNSRIAGIVCAALGGVLIIASLFTNRWLRAEFFGGDVGAGLRDAQVCVGGVCEKGSIASCQKYADAIGGVKDPMDFYMLLDTAPTHCRVLIGGSTMVAVDHSEVQLTQVPEVSLGAFLFFSRVTFYTSFLAALLLARTIGLAAAKKFVYRPVPPTTLLLFCVIVLLVSGPVTIAVNPFKGLGVDIGFAVFGAGVTLALFGGIMLGRLRPPHDSEWDDHLEPMVGGRLFLTNQRLLFEAHRVNVQREPLDVRLASIRGVAGGWTKFLGFIPLVPNALIVTLDRGDPVRFTVWGRAAWMAAIEAARESG